MYFVKSPWILKKIYPSLIWNIVTLNKNIYLTFDDGPHPTITPFVLETLKKFNAKASFFCIGKNVEQYPEIFNRIITAGHIVGNHTDNHLKGWQTDNEVYIENVKLASDKIISKLFRPPYGKIKRSQAKQLEHAGYNIIMWDILSGDFDAKISNETCLSNVISNSKEGSIVVFHDSEKAFIKLEYCLPKVLEHFTKLGFTFNTLPNF